MGANQSSGAEGSPSGAAQSRRCYYELLGVDVKASEDEYRAELRVAFDRFADWDKDKKGISPQSA